MKDDTARNAEDVPRRVLGIRIRLIRGDYHIGMQDRALHLNGPANIVFASLDGQRTIADLARLLVAEYGIDRSEAIADIHELLDDLTEKGIVEW
jgi:hypothetical protein